MELRVCVIFLCASLLLGIFDLSQGCDVCPNGEVPASLPPGPFQKSTMFLRRMNPITMIGSATCNKKKPRTNIRINPGQFLEIKRITNLGLFRVLELSIKVCKVTKVRVWYRICKFNPLFPTLIWRTRDVPVTGGCGCKTLKFILPVPPPGDLVIVDPNACGQTDVAQIRFYFTKNNDCNGKVKVKCVKMKACLRGTCTEG